MINVGTGIDISIKELAELIKKITDFNGEIIWNTAKPDGTPRKLMEVSKIKKMGWRHSIELEKGLQLVYNKISNHQWD